MLGVVRKSAESKTEGTILPLYKALVHPQGGCCVQFWSLYLRKDIAELEKSHENDQGCGAAAQ